MTKKTSHKMQITVKFDKPVSASMARRIAREELKSQSYDLCIMTEEISGAGTFKIKSVAA